VRQPTRSAYPLRLGADVSSARVIACSSAIRVLQLFTQCSGRGRFASRQASASKAPQHLRGSALSIAGLGFLFLSRVDHRQVADTTHSRRAAASRAASTCVHPSDRACVTRVTTRLVRSTVIFAGPQRFTRATACIRVGDNRLATAVSKPYLASAAFKLPRLCASRVGDNDAIHPPAHVLPHLSRAGRQRRGD